jgi:PadR family transcriptional regulator, regulatory protein PadR
VISYRDEATPESYQPDVSRTSSPSTRPAATYRLTEYSAGRTIGVMREPTFFILTALTDRPLHGYAVMQAVAELSGGRVRLRASTLYDALDRLAAEGLIEISGEEAVGRRLRRFYRLSPHGRAALDLEVRRLRANAAVAAQRLRASVYVVGPAS